MINKKIDYIDDPNDTFEQYLEKAKKYNFRAIFAKPEKEYDFAKDYLRDTDIIIAGAVDFPEGKMDLDSKMKRFADYAAKNFEEIDYPLNQKNVENRDFHAIEKEMAAISSFCKKNGIKDKVIVEMCKLDGDNAAKEKICEIANRIKPAFLKTSTGRSFSGAKIEDVKLMKRILDSSIKIKAAGGIHTYLEAKKFLNAGASILGASAGIKIVEQEKEEKNA
ncbi:deoxyribose-phosphate aldolase [Lactobacillus panisapium]|uniref:deoxyribose-phosphate aldolase n=1 Tax=Lactobacillus panisapium TaxID=2012495 RepID=UPI001C6A731D|nr:deoxyribose-phosphate aldolase [Lactobacillus panisapium]QYN56150.1 deoxyribose-phosphate aldolase [Lactobacillus panisapium]